VDAIDAIETTTGFTRSRKLLSGCVSMVPGTSQPENTRVGSFFSEREREVLNRIVSGLPDKVIAKQLGISVHGVRFHLKKIYDKLSVSSRGEVHSKAVELDVLAD
jgi:DNA-binding CsgD family transcriptional regulator